MAATLQQLSRDDLGTLWRDRMPQDFPKEEIKPLSLLLSLYDRGQNRTFALTDGGETLAYAILEVPDRGDVWLLDYLAVSSAARGRGLGSRVLSLLPAVLPDARAVMAEIERIDCAPDADALEVRTRRKRFYLRNGLRETGVFTRADGGIDYEILSLACRSHAVGGDAADAMENIYRTFFRPGEYTILSPEHACL